MPNIILIQELILCQKEYFNIPYSDSVQPFTHILAKFQYMFLPKKKVE